MKNTTKFFFVLFLFCLVSCTTPTDPGVCILDPVHLDIPFLAAPGGHCVQACAAMTASYVMGIQPTEAMLQNQTTWLGTEGYGVKITQLVPLFRDYWNLNGSRYQRPSLQDLYRLLQQQIPVVVLLDGWHTNQAHMYHAVVLTGMDPALVYVHDPVLGPTIYDHATFQALRAVAEHGVVVVRR